MRSRGPQPGVVFCFRSVRTQRWSETPPGGNDPWFGVVADRWTGDLQSSFLAGKFRCSSGPDLPVCANGIERMFHHTGWTMTVLAQEAAPPQDGLSSILSSPIPMFVLLGLMFWFMILRPQRRQKREHEQELKALQKHDRIVTAGGILGTIVTIKPDSDEITIRIDETTNTRMRILRSAISRKLTGGSEPGADT